MWANDTSYTVIKNATVVVSGSGPAIRVADNKLIIRDGPKDTPPLVLTRAEASRRLRHIIMCGQFGGFITFDAHRWMRDTGVAFSQLDYNGAVIIASGPRGPDQPALRRAQALICSGIAAETAVAIAREILRVKLAGQASVARLMGREQASATIADLGAALMREKVGAKLLDLEAKAARLYWAEWESLPVRFARDNPTRLDHKGRWRPGRSEGWLRFGSRASALTGKPWRATTPGNALLNFLLAIARTEMVVALHAVGLDEGVALFHADKDGRPSLALDALEAVRPLIEAWLLSFFEVAAFTGRDFYETADGEVRMNHPLNAHLAHTAALWRPACERIAGWLRQAFAEGIQVPARHAPAIEEGPPVPMLAGPWAARLPPGFPRPLPIQPPAGKNSSPGRGRFPRALLQDDPVPRTCWQCSRALPSGRRRFCTDAHAVAYHGETQWRGIVAATVERYADPKRAAASKAAIGKRAVENAAKRLLWRQRPGWSEAGDQTLRQWFAGTVQVQLRDYKIADIMGATGLSKQSVADIRAGRHTPHPRHFAVLAKLVGVEAPLF
jgi:CRISPR-associated endonuclease Cas1